MEAYTFSLDFFEDLRSWFFLVIVGSALKKGSQNG